MNHLLNLLIVDDNRANLALLEAVIREINVNLIKALSGPEALEKTRGIELALAIIDVRMPEMNGFELAIELNKERTGREVPVIFLTASEFNETDVFKGYDSGAVDYIFKPMNNKILISKIKVFLDLFDQKQTIIRNSELLKESAYKLIRVNDAIRASEANVHRIFDQSPVCLVMLGLDGIIIKSNAALCNFLGYSEDDLIGKAMQVMTYPEDIEIGMKEIKLILEGKIETCSFKKRYIRQDGNIVWGEISTGLVRDANNEPLYFLPVIQDITDSKRAEDELNVSRALLKSSLESQRDTILLSIDHNYKYLYFNKTHWDSMKYSYNQDVKLGMNILDCITSDDDRKIAKENYDLALRGESHSNVRIYGDVGVAWYESFFNPIFNDKLEIIGATAIARNITDRKKAEEELRESEYSLKIAQKIARMGSWELDMITQKSHWSENYYTIFGFEPASVKPSFELFRSKIHPDDIQFCDDTYATIKTTKTPSSFELRVIQTDGTVKWIQNNISPVIEDGKIVKLKGIFFDITDRKQIEKRQKQLNEELEDRVNERTAELVKLNNKIRQTRRNYETFFNTIDDFIFVSDEQGIIIHTNNTVIDRLGYTREEITGKSVLMVHPPDRREEAAIILSNVISGKAKTCPVPVITKSGIQIPVETKVSHGFWDGKPVIFGVTKDISKIKLSEERFSKLFYLNPSACSLSDLFKHKFIDVNEAFLTLLGYDKNDVIGKSIPDLGIMTIKTINTIIKNPDSSGKIRNVETSLKAKNGEIKHVLLSTENIRVQDKNYCFAVAHDITVRKRMDVVLSESEAQLAKAQQIAHIGSWTLDDKTHELWWSDETFRIFGYIPGAVKPTLELFSQSVHPEDQSFLQEAIKTAWDQLSLFDIDHRIILPNGEERTVHEQAEVMYDNAGQPKKWLGTVQDNTEKKQIQNNIIKAIIQTEEKEKAYFSKELHDGLGPLLSTIKLYLQWSQRPKSNKSKEEIIKEAQDILEDALTAVKEISNKLSPHILKDYGLTSAIQGFVDHLVDSSTIRVFFQSNVIRRLDDEIEVAIYRAIIECIYNTVKHAMANNITIRLNDHSSELQILYRDDGIGFDLTETLSEQKGLGLFNLQNRIKNIGGKITMFSKPGEGVNYQIVVNL